VWNTIGCTSTPNVAMYFFSNSPVKCLLTNVVFPTPPSPTRTNLNSGKVDYPSIYINNVRICRLRLIDSTVRAIVYIEHSYLP